MPLKRNSRGTVWLTARIVSVTSSTLAWPALRTLSSIGDGGERRGIEEVGAFDVSIADRVLRGKAARINRNVHSAFGGFLRHEDRPSRLVEASADQADHLVLRIEVHEGMGRIEHVGARGGQARSL